MVETKSDTDDPITEGDADNPEPDGSEPAIAGAKPDESADAERKREERERRNKRRLRRLRWRRAGVVGEFLLAVLIAVATSCSAYFVWGQWDAMSETLRATYRLVGQARIQAHAANRAAKASQAQVAEMREEFQAGQLPHLDIDEIEVGEPQPPQGIRRVTMRGINVGPGIAYRMKVQAFSYKPTSRGAPSVLIVPESPQIVAFQVEKPTIRRDETFKTTGTLRNGNVWNEFQASRVGVFEIAGWIQYCDSVRISRSDPFCWRFARLGATPGVGGGWHFRCEAPVENLPSPTPAVCR